MKGKHRQQEHGVGQQAFRHFHKPTLWLTGISLNMVSGWQIAHHYRRTLPDLGDARGTLLERIIHDSGQHFGISSVIGAVAAYYYGKGHPEACMATQLGAATALL